MMTKLKLDNLKELDTMTPNLNMAKLNSMIDVALAEPQEGAAPTKTHKTAKILHFPKPALWGGAGAGVAAALLLVTLNLPTTEATFNNLTSTTADNTLQFAESDEDFDLTADMLLLETLGV